MANWSGLPCPARGLFSPPLLLFGLVTARASEAHARPLQLIGGYELDAGSLEGRLNFPQGSRGTTNFSCSFNSLDGRDA